MRKSAKHMKPLIKKALKKAMTVATLTDTSIVMEAMIIIPICQSWNVLCKMTILEIGYGNMPTLKIDIPYTKHNPTNDRR